MPPPVTTHVFEGFIGDDGTPTDFCSRCGSHRRVHGLPPATVEQTWTVPRLAQAKGITPAGIHSHRRKGNLPPPDGHIGRTPYWYPESVAEFLAREFQPGWVAALEAARNSPNRLTAEQWSERSRASHARAVANRKGGMIRWGRKLKWVVCLNPDHPGPSGRGHKLSRQCIEPHSAWNYAHHRLEPEYVERLRAVPRPSPQRAE